MANLKLVFKYAFGDLAKQKGRTLLGMFGIFISVGLLAIVLFVADSVSVSFVDYLSIDAGDQDAVITVRHYNGEADNRSDFFEYEKIIDQIEEATDDVEDYIPRMEVDGKVNISEGFDTKDLSNVQENVLISGIDFEEEEELGFGYFLKEGSTEEVEYDDFGSYDCLIYYGCNDLIRYDEDENIKIFLSLEHGGETIEKNVTFKIQGIMDYMLKWPNEYRSKNLIAVDINTLYDIFGTEFDDTCSKLILTFKDKDDIYDVRDVDGSKRKVKEIASDIQLELGLDAWDVDLPKLEILGYSEYLSMGITIIFVFVSIISMLIAGILINGILKTSVEERIREFGIFRTLGAHKGFNLQVVLMQGFLLSLGGSLVGIGIAFFGTQYILIPYANEYVLEGFTSDGIGFAFRLESIFIALAMGVSVGMLVSISPALKVLRLQLIESIHPYRHEDSMYHLQKRASVNYKLIIVGIILASNGGFIYFVIPRLFLSMDIALMAGTLIAILLIFLIGLTLAGLGLMPIILRGVIALFKPFAKKTHAVIKIFVFRYQRRNSSTIVIFALSFSFVMFTSTILQTQSNQVSTMIRIQYGSDLVIETTGWVEESEYWVSGGMFSGGGGGGGMFTMSASSAPYSWVNQGGGGGEDEGDYADELDPSRIMTTVFMKELLNIEGVERVSSVLANTKHLTQLYGGEDKEFQASIGDYAGLSSESITLIGIDEEYLSTVDTHFVVLEQGDRDEAFDSVFENETDYHCIINEGLAVELKLNIGDKIRLVIERGDELESYPFIVSATASVIPGFTEAFGHSRYSAEEGGVLISQDIYMEILDLPYPQWVEKIFIKLTEDGFKNAGDIEEEIDDLYKNDYDYDLINLERRVERQQQAFAVMDTFFMIILMATVIICLFGLLSSSYSTIIERKKEIGIVRTLGLKGRDVDRMFIIEALIIMISSGTVGTLVGWSTAFLLSSNMNLFTDIPYQPTFPWMNLLVIYSLSVAFILVGMHLLLRKSRKQKIVEIYRED